MQVVLILVILTPRESSAKTFVATLQVFTRGVLFYTVLFCLSRNNVLFEGQTANTHLSQTDRNSNSSLEREPAPKKLNQEGPLLCSA
jgi:hypothetical protein